MLGLLLVIDFITGLLLHAVQPVLVDLGPTVFTAFVAGCSQMLQRKFANRN